MKCILFVLIIFAIPAQAQLNKPVVVMDFVQVKDNHFAEALYYYEQNWKQYRDEALAKGYITGYRMLQTISDSAANFHLVLITEYADSIQYSKSEKNFEGIIQRLRPGGAALLNDLKPAQFRNNLFYKITTEVLAPEQSKFKKRKRIK
jgi:hypothetical protein